MLIKLSWVYQEKKDTKHELEKGNAQPPPVFLAEKSHGQLVTKPPPPNMNY